jgi:SAM-dependent methyltransferase
MATTRHDRATDPVLQEHLDRLARSDAAMAAAAEGIRGARATRDASIREAAAAGLSLRQIGGALGLSAQGVNSTLANGPKPVYDTIGQTYSQTRRPDPRIRDAIWAALGNAKSVVNVGAGTGSYEPPQTLLAVEPSMVMIAQRSPELAPAAVTTAARIPLPDKSVDAALASLTIHHWTDREACFAELRRVAKRIVVFTWDQELTDTLWLTDYVPAIIETDARVAVPIDWICEQLGTTDVRPVPVPWDCTDGFMGAYWRRPEAYLDPVVRNGISTLTRVDQQVLNAGLEVLLEDLQSGAWHRDHADLLELEELDLGYRLVVADVA